MTRSWVGWLAFAVLAATIAVTSCQALWAPDAAMLEQLR